MLVILEKIFTFVIENYYKSKTSHMTTLFFIGLLGAPLVRFFERYIFSEWDFLGFLGVLIIVDTLTGMLKGLKYNTFSSDTFGSLFQKLFIYALCLVTIHAITTYVNQTAEKVHFEILKSIALNFDHMLYFSILFRELWSINENINALGYVFLPKFVLKHMKNFDENGHYTPPKE
jgi:MFS superfamily sulfate permease-like transporter